MGTKEIQNIIIDLLSDKSFSIICDNTTALHSESDVIGINQKGYIYEYEVKVSRADFKAEFRNKVFKHQLLSKRMSHNTYQSYKPGTTIPNGEKYDIINIPNRFFFACEEGLIKPEELPEYAGLVYVYDDCVKEIKNAPLLHRVKANSILYKRLAHLLSYRYTHRCSLKSYRDKKLKS